MKIQMLLALVGFAGVAAAQSSITLTVDSLGCSTTAGSNIINVQSWNLGATNTTQTNTGGSTVGAAQIGPLVVVKSSDECTAKLFAAVATGLRFTTVTLTESDAQGRRLMAVQWSSAVITGLQFSGSTTAPLPTESVSVSGKQFSVTYFPNNSKTCWDISAQRSCPI